MQKDCADLLLWIKSIVNHMYWCAASTPDGNGLLIMAKWKSLNNHIQNVHEHDDPLHSACSHPPIEENEPIKKWLKPSMYRMFVFIFTFVSLLNANLILPDT